MENYLDISMQLRKELEALPREYTQTMARRNWDVVYYMVINFNIGRFLIFMDNYYHGIPDKIVITKFGVDGPPTTAILYYDGYLITYVIDDTRFTTNEFYTYYGNEIAVSRRILNYGNERAVNRRNLNYGNERAVNRRNLNYGNEEMIDYNLITSDGKEIQILGIWAGFKS